MDILDLNLLRMRASILCALGLVAGCAGDDGQATAGNTTTATDPGTTEPTATSETTSATTDGTSGTATDATTTDATTTAGTTAGTTTAGTTDATTTGTEPVTCEGSTPIDQADVDGAVPSGFELCPNGAIHRVDAVTCESPATPDSCTDNSMGGCGSADDCTEHPFGSCQQDMVFGGLFEPNTCSCVYGCATDDDCDTGEICRCAGSGLGLYTQCIEGGCVDNSECDGYLCGLSPDACAPGGFLTACFGPDDECYGSEECSGDCHYYTFSDPPLWECQGVACGRPFLIADRACVAPVRPESPDNAAAGDRRETPWHAGIRPETAALSPALRARVAAGWSEIAAMEHASVASFARAILALMAVGAPASLVEATQTALAEEIDHARRAFALASAYAGHNLGPGPLEMEGALEDLGDRQALALAVAREACVAETLAAAEAQAAHDRATDPIVRASLARIAADEAAHANLGWRTLAWLLGGLAPAAREATLAALWEAADFDPADPAEANRAADTTAEDTSIERFGLLTPATRAEVQRATLAAVIHPCIAALQATKAA